MLIKDAATVWNTLRGLICVYKPADIKVERVRDQIIHSICTELNEMECRPPDEYVQIIGDPLRKLTVTVQQNLADHPLVVGPRYQIQDVVMSWSNYLGFNTSGVLLFGINKGTKYAKHIRENHPTRAYRIKGKLGRSTDDCYKTGKVVEKTTWKHVKQFHMEKFLATLQATHQQKMFELSGVDIRSQVAYDLASKGPIRPRDSKIPILYGIKCVDFEPPEFTIEIQCINEYESYLKYLIHEIGYNLHSSAHCTGIQCIRHSHFTLDHTLLQKHWTLQNIITNLENCNNILSNNQYLLKQESAALM